LAFTQNATLGALWGLVATARDRLTRLQFSSAQEFGQALARELGLTGNELVVRYDTVTKNLTYQVNFERSFRTTVPLGVAAGVQPGRARAAAGRRAGGRVGPGAAGVHHRPGPPGAQHRRHPALPGGPAVRPRPVRQRRGPPGRRRPTAGGPARLPRRAQQRRR